MSRIHLTLQAIIIGLRPSFAQAPPQSPSKVKVRILTRVKNHKRMETAPEEKREKGGVEEKGEGVKK